MQDKKARAHTNECAFRAEMSRPHQDGTQHAGEGGVEEWGLHRRNKSSSAHDMSELQDMLLSRPETPMGASLSQHSVSGVTGEALQKELMERLRQDRRKKAIAPQLRDNASHFTGALIWCTMIFMLWYVFSNHFAIGGDEGGEGSGKSSAIDEDWAT